MKISQTRFVYILAVLFVFNACDKKEDCNFEQVQYYYEPVVTPWSEINASIGSEIARDIKNPGKIFLFGRYLFINEVNTGIHIIDNIDPTNPVNIHFINVPGSLDISIFGNTLYTDNYSDLISIDISDFANTQVVERVRDVFSNNSLGFYFQSTEEGVITEWKALDTIIEIDCDSYFSPDIWFEDDVIALESSDGGVIFASDAAQSNSNDVIGVAGSMARFALWGSNLYVVDAFDLKVFDWIDGLNEVSSQYIEWGLETIFPYQNYLFIGGNSGMYIMDISEPTNPAFVSAYAHINSCDPVVVKDDYAYVTLRSGNDCQNFTNQLDILDISNIEDPELISTNEMFNPHGLGITNNDILFLCDGDDGLKIYDTSNKLDIQLIKHYSDINAFDVIPFSQSLFMIGSDGFYQYDYSDINDVHLISTIPVAN